MYELHSNANNKPCISNELINSQINHGFHKCI